MVILTGCRRAPNDWINFFMLIFFTVPCYFPALSVTTTEELVYLTADSPDTITQLEKGKVYILGGLVDRNAHKGLCFKKATVCSKLVSYVQCRFKAGWYSDPEALLLERASPPLSDCLSVSL